MCSRPARPTSQLAFISLSPREPNGRDAEYLEWHHLDHRPEQHRLAGLRQSLRLVSTPACRAARAASNEHFDPVDHVMTYLFNDAAALPGFYDLGGALHAGGRMSLRLPTVELMTANLAGALAAPAASRAPTSFRGVRRGASTSSSKRGRHRSTPSSTFPVWPASGGTTAPTPRPRMRPMPAAGRSPTAISTTIRSPPPSGWAR